jgi:hypothetical protein
MTPKALAIVCPAIKSVSHNREGITRDSLRKSSRESNPRSSRSADILSACLNAPVLQTSSQLADKMSRAPKAHCLSRASLLPVWNNEIPAELCSRFLIAALAIAADPPIWRGPICGARHSRFRVG